MYSITHDLDVSLGYFTCGSSPSVHDIVSVTAAQLFVLGFFGWVLVFGAYL